MDSVFQDIFSGNMLFHVFAELCIIVGSHYRYTYIGFVMSDPARHSRSVLFALVTEGVFVHDRNADKIRGFAGKCDEAYIFLVIREFNFTFTMNL
jgi:hypothetical protein